LTTGSIIDIIKFGRIEVGEESFIGARSVIMPGVKIGRNCVVGAGSVVTKDIPDETVVCGVPARSVCSTKEYAEKCKVAMDVTLPEFDQEAYMKDKKKFLIENIK
jgi:acetyltransferase-like isoleucine patch superfamily enzyme